MFFNRFKLQYPLQILHQKAKSFPLEVTKRIRFIFDKPDSSFPSMLSIRKQKITKASARREFITIPSIAGLLKFFIYYQFMLYPTSLLGSSGDSYALT